MEFLRETSDSSFPPDSSHPRLDRGRCGGQQGEEKIDNEVRSSLERSHETLPRRIPPSPARTFSCVRLPPRDMGLFQKNRNARHPRSFVFFRAVMSCQKQHPPTAFWAGLPRQREETASALLAPHLVLRRKRPGLCRHAAPQLRPAASDFQTETASEGLKG